MTQQQVSALRPALVVTDILGSRLNLRWDLCVMRNLQNAKTTFEIRRPIRAKSRARTGRTAVGHEASNDIKEHGEYCESCCHLYFDGHTETWTEAA